MWAGICNIGISRCRSEHCQTIKKMEKGICMCYKIRYFVES